jgi:hypothetical protein
VRNTHRYIHSRRPFVVGSLVAVWKRYSNHFCPLFS